MALIGIFSILARSPVEHSSETSSSLSMVSGKHARKLLRQGAYGFLVVLQQSAPSVSANLSSAKSVELVETDSLKRLELQNLLDKYSDCFPDELPSDLPPKRLVNHEIDLEPGSSPPSRPAFRLSRPELDELQRQLNELLKRGLIEPSKSPFGAPVFFVKKADGSLRLVCDWRQLNRITIKNKACLPNIDDLFDAVQGSQYFSKLDLMSGYHQVRIREEDIPKTAINTPLGHYEFKVMGFGLTNAPATFQSLMNSILHPYLRKKVVVFLDDILILSKSWDEHLQDVSEILNVLCSQKLYCKPSKCVFATKSVKFLGHCITGQTLTPDKSKLEAVSTWPRPTSIPEIRKFLGFANYFRRFVPNYSHIARPLEEHTGRYAKFSWSDNMEKAFQKLKQCLLIAPVLELFNPDKKLRVVTDASDFAVGGVLLQESADSEWHPIAYCSRRLTQSERNYTAVERETVAIIYALQAWKLYLFNHFELVTDNRAVTYLQTKANLTKREGRWVQFLADFHFSICHQPGRNNVADALSRNPEHQLHALRSEVTLSSEMRQAIVSGYKKDKKLYPIIKRLKATQHDSFHERYAWDKNRSYYSSKLILLGYAFPMDLSN